MIKREFKIDPDEIEELNMLIQRYNDTLAECDLKETMAAGACLEHGLAHLHMLVVNIVDAIRKQIVVDDIIKQLAEGRR